MLWGNVSGPAAVVGAPCNIANIFPKMVVGDELVLEAWAATYATTSEMGSYSRSKQSVVRCGSEVGVGVEARAQVGVEIGGE